MICSRCKNSEVTSKSKHCKWCRDCLRRYNQERNLERKVIVLRHYNNGNLECTRCGFDDVLALSVDHISGGGLIHLRSLGISGGSALYRWLIKNDFPHGFQTLCMCCQFIKEVESSCLTKHDDKKTRYITKLKLDVISRYSITSSCSCGYSDVRALIIDHITGGGRKHRTTTTKSGGWNFYRWLRKNGYPPGYAVLCANCQMKKEITSEIGRQTFEKQGFNKISQATRKLNSVVAARTVRQATDAFYDLIMPVIKQDTDTGATYREVAEILNTRGFKTQTGASWTRDRVASFIAYSRSRVFHSP